MAREIERKFLVTGDEWRRASKSCRKIQQAYLALSDALTIRIRIIEDREALVCIKSARQGAMRSEYEYAIPIEDAREMMSMRTGVILNKRRHIVEAHDMEWEVDVFEEAHRGLVLAEIELDDAEATFQRPSWLGAEVTNDHRYYNGFLATRFPTIVHPDPDLERCEA
ncbi:MAG: CYTH domain-containing protein [Alphaproteobacteria bacterium]|nr:CYTH domain-containing protein [Alphaproteobacteria bacterium]